MVIKRILVCLQIFIIQINYKYLKTLNYLIKIALLDKESSFINKHQTLNPIAREKNLLIRISKEAYW